MAINIHEVLLFCQYCNYNTVCSGEGGREGGMKKLWQFSVCGSRSREGIGA